MMSVIKCEVCRGYYRHEQAHRCHGLRTVDWVRFVQALRHWLETDRHAQFEAYYARRRLAERQAGS